MAEADQPSALERVRLEAERRLEEQGALPELPAADLRALLHDLRVHQIELQLQNEELRHAQEEEQASLQRLSDLFHHAPIGYAVVNETGVIQEANETLARMLETTRDRLTGRPFSRWLAAADRPAFLARFRALFRHPADKQLECGLSVGERHRQVVITGRHAPTMDEAPAELLLSITDVTAAHEARAAARQEAARNAAILSSISDAFFALDRDLRITYFNEAAERVLGRTRDEVVGRPLLDAFPEARGSVFAERYRRAIETGETDSFEFHFAVAPYENWYDVRVYPQPDGISVYFQVTTDRKRAEQELRASEELMRYIVKHDPNALAVYDRDLHYVAVSDRYLHDYGVKAEDILGKHHYEVFPEMPQRWKEVHQRVLAGATEGSEDDYFDRPDGSRTYNRWECRPWYQADGSIGGIITYTEVTTERKLAEQALRDSEQRYRLAQQLAQVGTWEWQMATGELHWSDEVFGFFGIEPGAANLDTFTQRVHPDDLAAWQASVQACLAEGKPHDVEFRAVQPDGSDRWLAACGDAERDDDGHPIRMVGVVMDVTDRREAEAALRYSERLLTWAIEQLPVPVIIADAPDVVITRYNHAAMDLLAAPTKHLEDIALGDHRQYWPTFYPDGTPYDVADLPLTRACQQGEITAGAEIIVRRPDGDRWISASAAPLRNEQGEVVAGIVVFPDITERREAEESLAELTATLERRVQQRTAELEHANAELEAFAYSVSHDLRAPLRAISGFAAIIAERHRQSLDEEGRHYFDNIAEASERLSHMTEDLLRYSRLGRKGMALLPVSLGDPVAAARRSLEARFAESGAVLELPARWPRVVAEETLLEQVFVNLFDNAIKYQRQDNRPHLRLTWRSEAETVQVDVADNGIGIDPRFHDKIFHVFQRLHSEDAFAGTGIGLALVAKAMALVGGQAWVDSQPGAGSTFHLVLQRAPAGPAAAS